MFYFKISISNTLLIASIQIISKIGLFEKFADDIFAILV
jgi:hypothetical protein